MKTKIEQMLSAVPFVCLSTLNGDAPETRAMINIHNPAIAPHLKFKKEEKIFYFITNTSSSKIGQIRKNKKASVYIVLPDTFEGILLSGVIKEVTDKTFKDGLWHDSWKMYYPDGKDGGDFSVLAFTPEKYKYYDGKFNKEEGVV